MGSMHWTDEEAKYLKAIFSWQAKADDDKASRASRSKLDLLEDAEKKPPAGEFRILVVGAKGCGKTSILTRFCAGTFRGESEPADPFFERGCRHQIELSTDDGEPLRQQPEQPSSRLLPQLSQQQQQQQPQQQQTNNQNHQQQQQPQQTARYIIDALEMPSKHLSSNLMLEQALAITEGAVLVYDVADASSLRLAVRVHDFIRDSLLSSSSSAVSTTISSTSTSSGNGNNNDKKKKKSTVAAAAAAAASAASAAVVRREYGLLLVGNKSDVDDEDRAVPWAEGSRTAAGFKVRCAFMEASAKSGENVSAIFPTLGLEILRLKKLNRQRREEAERAAAAAAALLKLKAQAGHGGRGRRRIWRAITNPFVRRREDGGGGGGGGQALQTA